MLLQDPAPPPPSDPPPAGEEVVVLRACEACGATMQSDQDWCLECGTAAPGRLGTKPGMRAAATVVAVTLALVGGAVAASYAALSTDAQQEAKRPAPPSGAPVAQAPPATTAPVTPVVPPAAGNLPVTPPATTAPTIKIPTTPLPTTPPATNTPTPTPTPSPTPSAPSTGSGGGSGSSGSSGKEDDEGTTTTKPAALEEIELGADVAALYDPSSRAQAKGDPADAIDGDTGSSWFATTDSPDKDMALGLVIDLESKKGVRVLEVATKTPGFRVEVYAADSDELPPDILDTRWAHITDRSDVDGTDGRQRNKKGDGKERIVLGGGSAKYRHVLLWVTKPPTSGATVRLSEVTLYG